MGAISSRVEGCELDEVEGVQGRPLGHEALGEDCVAAHSREMERRQHVPSPYVDVGARLEESLDTARVLLVDRKVQRREAVLREMRQQRMSSSIVLPADVQQEGHLLQLLCPSPMAETHPVSLSGTHQVEKRQLVLQRPLLEIGARDELLETPGGSLAGGLGRKKKTDKAATWRGVHCSKRGFTSSFRRLRTTA